MSKAIAAMLAILLGTHGLLGLFIEGDKLIGLFNVDILLDLIYLGSALALAIIANENINGKLTRIGLFLLGGLHFVLGAYGLLDRHLLFLAPTGLELFDFLLYFSIAGVCFLGVILPDAEKPIWQLEPSVSQQRGK